MEEYFGVVPEVSAVRAGLPKTARSRHAFRKTPALAVTGGFLGAPLQRLTDCGKGMGTPHEGGSLRGLTCEIKVFCEPGENEKKRCDRRATFKMNTPKVKHLVRVRNNWSFTLPIRHGGKPGKDLFLREKAPILPTSVILPNKTKKSFTKRRSSGVD